MHPKHFFTIGGLYILGLLFFKIIFGQFFDTSSENLIIAYLAVIAVYSIAIIRRAGILSYPEVVLVGIVWTLVAMFIDLFVTASFFFGLTMYLQPFLWLGYLVPLAAIFLFHKKRHVHIRRGGHIESHH